ncbi:response regulator [Yersinia mollaretii]|uniref:Response regulator n=1 Tax=Yersinia mollaretii TaxID=33060 RepID=A0AA44CNZ4_YERMO|nr:response regulator [Yersinia mollaretii]NIL24259.1 response regulator [Yersinia mollaretii]CNJ22166.1 DNA-binding transcriptional regulator RstA [Yersinia mollaretii]CQR09484.1 DNA-binding transcriptional regulator RstA [Yersinia mollaretii]
MSKVTKILLVEDDHRLATLIAEFLAKQLFQVKVISRGDTAVEYVRNNSLDLILLDIMLPGMNGLDVCKVIREFYNGPIIMITALGESLDEILGLELGADDYIIKPIEPRVLLARVRAQLRRFNQPVSNLQNSTINTEESTKLEFGQLTIIPTSRTVTLYEQEIPMTTAEFDVLLLLAKDAGKVLSRDELLLGLKGIDFDGVDRTIDIHISRLRRKLDDDLDTPSRIKTLRGKGYLFNGNGWS